MPFLVVLTGGIASGKTAVANEFLTLGIPVLDTDEINRDVIAVGAPALAQIVAAFGPEILDGSGNMDRARMRERVFSDAAERKKLVAITHPAIREELAKRSVKAGGTYQIHAIPLYVEGGGKGPYDRVLVVDCSEELQLERLARRDGIERALAKKILAAQAGREQRRAAADDVITNDGSLDALRSKVAALHKEYLLLAATKSRPQIG